MQRNKQNNHRIIFFIGLVIVTGVLWGCSNPFLRAGARGLTAVRAHSALGQAYSEIKFLITNWKYVCAWCVNQCGSVSFVAATRGAGGALAMCVPAANGLAALCGALTAAATGAEDPLDAGSILGVVLILGGTALCCWDHTT